MSVPTVRSAVTLVFIQSYGTMAIQFAAIMVLSRLLTPQEIGIFSLGAIIYSIISYFRDLGIGTYIVRAEHLNSDQIRSATGLNLLSTMLSSIVLYLCAPHVADFYGVDGVADVVRAFAITCLIIGLGTIPMAYHRRQLNFLPQFWIALIQAITSAAVSITLSLLGFGYMALAYGQLAAMLATTIACILLRPADFPLLPRFNGLGPILRFGTRMVWINTLDRFGKGLPELVIARTVGVESSALFSRGNGLVDIFRNGLESITNSVSMPYYAQQHRDGFSLRPATRRTLDIALALGWPFAAVLCVLAPEFLQLLFGHQWIGATDYLRILCAALAVELLALPAKDLLVACGRVATAARMQTIVHTLRIVLVLGAASFGALAVCWALVVAGLGGATLTYRTLGQELGITSNDVWQGIRIPLLIGTGTGAVTWGVGAFSSPWAMWATLVTTLFAGSIAWVTLIFGLDHPLRGEIQNLFRRR